MKHLLTTSIAALVLSACVSTQEDVVITEVDPAFMPPSIITAINAERLGFTPVEVLKKVRGERVYYDVEGELEDGTEIEFDILMNGEAAEIVEIQRDLTFEQMPSEVQAMVDETEATRPARIIESVQTDGSVIYEFFSAEDPADPAYEIRSHEGKLERLTERWIH